AGERYRFSIQKRARQRQRTALGSGEQPSISAQSERHRQAHTIAQGDARKATWFYRFEVIERQDREVGAESKVATFHLEQVEQREHAVADGATSGDRERTPPRPIEPQRGLPQLQEPRHGI